MTKGATPWQVAKTESILESGDWATLPPGGGSSDLKAVHESLANLMLVLAVIHVAGVAVESRLLRRNLVRPMITGRR